MQLSTYLAGFILVAQYATCSPVTESLGLLRFLHRAVSSQSPTDTPSNDEASADKEPDSKGLECRQDYKTDVWTGCDDVLAQFQLTLCGSGEEFCGDNCQDGSCSGATETTSSTTAKPSATEGLAVSTNGDCAYNSGFTCKGSKFGDCCSAAGYCGDDEYHCDKYLDCQPEFGNFNERHRPLDEQSQVILPQASTSSTQPMDYQLNHFGLAEQPPLQLPETASAEFTVLGTSPSGGDDNKALCETRLRCHIRKEGKGVKTETWTFPITWLVGDIRSPAWYIRMKSDAYVVRDRDDLIVVAGGRPWHTLSTGARLPKAFTLGKKMKPDEGIFDYEDWIERYPRKKPMLVMNERKAGMTLVAAELQEGYEERSLMEHTPARFVRYGGPAWGYWRLYAEDDEPPEDWNHDLLRGPVG
ncbi:unnamed protein product [Fusarium equiseti]|uniref:Chitin-binding type-1 domain-containing protein n=1 Tax=Fusarium equiseti TaxID=61235 RepID=A0A8J2NED4_FUSEQ|nr:unnamed protein product [Fusarium equiseti]